MSWTTRDCSFKGWIINGTNLIQTLPNQKQTLEAIQNLDLMVVIDTMPMEITGWADVILPECTYLERYDDIRTSPHRKPQIALRMPAAEPKYNTKPAYWMARQLAIKLGLEAYFPHENLEDLLDWQLKQVGSSGATTRILPFNQIIPRGLTRGFLIISPESGEMSVE